MGVSSNAQKIKHIILISLDGSRPEFYTDSVWYAPNLKWLKENGAYAEKGVESVFPSLTWPAHTSIITGANPGVHGVYFNRQFDGEPGQGYWYYSYIRTNTIFDAVKEGGMTSGAVWWPVTVAGPIDFNFPVRRAEKGERGDALSIRYPYIRPESLLSDIEKEIGRKFTPDDLDFKGNAQGNLVYSITRHIIKVYKPNFLAIHLGEMDHAQHGYGAESAQLKDALRYNDSLIGKILNDVKDAGIADSTAIIITGDHGHINTKASFAPNVYLSNNGFISKNCWEAKFHAAGGSAFLYLKDKDDKSILDSVIRILKNTTEYKKGYFRIIDREQLDKMGANPDASLAIATKEGINVLDRDSGDSYTVQSSPYKSTHGYDPKYASMHTTFIAFGPGIKHEDLKDMKLIDVAPYIANLLNLKFKPEQ